jgi:hypothetical protein
MRNANITVRALTSACNGHKSNRLVDLGAGDGSFLLQVARQLSPPWYHVRAVLLDRQNVFLPGISRQFTELGWQLQTIQADIFDWLANSPTLPAREVMLANLFLHHFTTPQLAALLKAVAKRARVFIAVEPRRSAWSFAFSRLVRVIGCNHVTRHDAPASVQAGFTGTDLSALWPAGGNWALQEREAGPFSHLFVANKEE